MTKLKSNIIICKTPRNDGLSNILSMPADQYKSGEFYMDFNKISTIEDIIERLEWMESRGYHLTNDSGRVYRSKNIAAVVSELYDYSLHTREIQSYATRLLTRSGNLRGRVIDLINEMLDNGDSDE